MNRAHPTFTVGDRVAYSVQFLRSIGMSHGTMAHARGMIQEVTTLGSLSLAIIDWYGIDAAELPERVNVCNLAHVGPNRRFANVD